MNCPACGHELNVGMEMKINRFVAWCGYGPCPSSKANDGADGKTRQEAIDNLLAALEKNPDWSDELPEEPDAAKLNTADHKNQIEKDGR